MNFDNDIFISYAHLDNQPLIKDSEGWVSQFHYALSVRVGQLLGKESSVWRDPKIQGNDFFDETIIEQLQKVALLVSIFSPRYVRSAWCTKELVEFCEVSEKSGGPRILDKTRIFKVLKTPVPVDEHPLQVRNCAGYEFFKIDPASGRVRELDQVLGGDTEFDYWTKLDDLAQDLCQLLALLGRAPSVSSPDDVPAKMDTVFVADCSDDVKDQRDEVKRDLLGQQYRVLPGRPLPLHVNELVPVLKESLDQSRLSVHVLGKSYGIVPEGTDRSVVELQNDLAIEREEKGEFSRLVWIAPGLEAEEDRQEHFIATLRSDPRTQEGADLLETPLEDLKTQIHQSLAHTRVGDAASQTSNEPIELNRVHLMCDSRDFKNAKSVADYLFEHGCEVTLPAFEGDEAEVRADNEENLRSADGVLIYYGAPNELWLRGKLREARKSAGMGRTKPLKATAILVAPPNSKQENWLRTHEARVIRQPNGFSADLLDPFLADLQN